MDQIASVVLCMFGSIFIVALMLVMNSIKIVSEYQRLVVFRLGRCIGEKGPGLVLLIPLVDRAVKVDLREQVYQVQNSDLTTRDQVHVSVDFHWYFRVIDPTMLVLRASNFEVTAKDLASATMRAVIAETTLQSAQWERELLGNDFCVRMGTQMEPFGVKVLRVEIRDVRAA